MSVVDTGLWKSFRLGDLFNIVRGTSRTMRMLDEGNIPVIAAARADQGVAGCYDVKPEYEDAITISCNGVGCGSVFYHDGSFAITGDASVMQEKQKMSRAVKLFIAAVCDSLFSVKYSYAEKCNPVGLAEEMIFLPATPDGQPDWAYMDTYMGEVLKKEEVFAEHLASLTAEAVVDGHKLDTSEWKAFRIGELFEILLAKGDIQPKQVADGMIPLVSAGNEDNGIVAFIDEAGDGVSEIFPAGCITVSMFGKAFYQPERFYAVSHGRINILQPKVEFSSIVGTFLTACLSRVLESKYDYATMCTQKKLATESISLPVTLDGTPDWAWMEAYMQQQMDKAAALVEHLDAVWN